MNASINRSRSIVDSVGKELKDNPPGILKRTEAKFGKARADKQRKAILLSKARNKGASV